MFGSGISPGYVNQLAVVAAGICDRVDKISIHEAADTTFYDSPATEKPVGFGQPIDSPDLQAMTAHGTGVFGEAVRVCRPGGLVEITNRNSSVVAQILSRYPLNVGGADSLYPLEKAVAPARIIGLGDRLADLEGSVLGGFALKQGLGNQLRAGLF